MDNVPLEKNIYTPDSYLRNPGGLAREMFRDLGRCRYLAWRLFIRNMTAQYRQTVLGFLWLLLPPLVQTAVWVFLNSQKILKVGVTDIPYPVFVLTGMLLWQVFSEALLSPQQHVSAAKSMLTKIRFPHEAILLAAIGQVLVNFLVRAGLLIMVLLWFDMPLSTSLFYAPIGVLALMGFGMMIGLLLLPFSLLYGDVQRLLVMAVSLWFFVTPVIYPVPTSNWAVFIANLNPMTPLLVTSRQLLTGGALTHLTPFLIITVVTLILSMVGWVFYRIAMPHLIERIGA